MNIMKVKLRKYLKFEFIYALLTNIVFNPKKVKISHSKKVIFYFSPTIPDYDESSGGRRATLLLEMMAKNFDVYAFYRGNPRKKYIKKLKSIGVYPVGLLWNIERKTAFSDVDVLFFAWYNSYYQFKKVVKWFPNARIIIDSVDVHWIREERLIGFTRQFKKSKVASNKIKEIEAYAAGDIILAVSDQDRRHILQELPLQRVEVVSNIHSPEVSMYKDNGSNKILYLGGFKHYPNIDSVKFLAEVIFPKVLELVPTAELIIAGSNAPEEIIQLGELPSVTFRGFIPEEELKDLYASIFISVVPLFAGSGVKGKISESIAFRIPVITNDIGNEGLNLIHCKEALICENSEMVYYIERAMSRQFDFDNMTAKAWMKTKKYMSKSIVEQKLMSILKQEE